MDAYTRAECRMLLNRTGRHDWTIQNGNFIIVKDPAAVDPIKISIIGKAPNLFAFADRHDAPIKARNVTAALAAALAVLPPAAPLEYEPANPPPAANEIRPWDPIEGIRTEAQAVDWLRIMLTEYCPDTFPAELNDLVQSEGVRGIKNAKPQNADHGQRNIAVTTAGGNTAIIPAPPAVDRDIMCLLINRATRRQSAPTKPTENKT